MAQTSSTTLVYWTMPVRRRLRRALAKRMVQPNSNEPYDTMNDFGDRLRQLFRETELVLVQELFQGFRVREEEFIFLVELGEPIGPRRHVVKFGPAEKLEKEFLAWKSCFPDYLDKDIVLMNLREHRAENGELIGLVYEDAQQFLSMESPSSLEEAFLDSVRVGAPSPSSLAGIFNQLYERLGQLLYSECNAIPEEPSALGYEFRLRPNRKDQCPVGRCLNQWQTDSSVRDIRQDATTWVSKDPTIFRDPVDYLVSLSEYVSWPHLDGFPEEPKVKPSLEKETGKPLETYLPKMLRGPAHGDLHGRNVHVDLRHGRAVWPAVFDYEDMHRDNLLGWDFVKMETELKIRAYPIVFTKRSMREFVNDVEVFEQDLIAETDLSQQQSRWLEVGAPETPRDRLFALLLWVRHQASLHLGKDRGRPREWLDEYYFLLACYGVSVVRFENLEDLERTGAFLSAGYSLGRFSRNRF